MAKTLIIFFGCQTKVDELAARLRLKTAFKHNIIFWKPQCYEVLAGMETK